MAFAIGVSGGIPEIKQTGSDVANDAYAGINTAITAVATIARSTAYTTDKILKPLVQNGMWFRCSTAGTTDASAPVYTGIEGGTVTDGTAVFTAVLAPQVINLGTGNFYFFPRFRFRFEGTLTHYNPQQSHFMCWDVIGYGASAFWTSGKLASDGITPLWDGTHFISTRLAGDNSSPASLQLQGGAKCNFIGGQVQVASAIGLDNGTTPKSYKTTWRNTKEWGNASSRIRAYSSLAEFEDCQFFDVAYDLFRMPAKFSVKGRGCEYLAQYVGASAGGADAKFVASKIENIDGTYDFDNYFGGNIELEDCKAGTSLKVVSQYPNSTIWSKHCVPTYQNIKIIPKDTSGIAITYVKFFTKEVPSNMPTVTFTTAGGLKVWDFRNASELETATNASGIATLRPVYNVDYWQGSFKESIRYQLGPVDTFGVARPRMILEARSPNYKTVQTPIDLGFEGVLETPVGMVALDTPMTVTTAAADAITGITLTPIGATGGNIEVDANIPLITLWNYYRAWISKLANKNSVDTWSCVGGLLSIGAWNITVKAGKTLSGNLTVDSLATTGLVTNLGNITVPFSDADGSRVLVTNLDPENFGVTFYLRYKKPTDTTWITSSGTGNTSTLLMDIGIYIVQARVPGYDWKTVSFDTTLSLSLDLNLAYHVSANNTPQYTMSYDTALEAEINYDAVKMAVAVENTTGAISQPGFAELYRATQRIQHIPALVWFWTNPVTANSTSQKILIPAGNPLSFFLTDNSNASVKVSCPVIHADTGNSADDRVKGNPSGFSIILGSPATAESAGLQSAIVSDILAKIGGTGYATENHSLANIKTELALVKNTVENLENYDDTALTAKVEAIPTNPVLTTDTRLDAIGTPLQASNYIAPDNTKIGQIKSKVDTLQNYDDTTITTKVEAIKTVVDSIKTTVEDKTGYSLTTAQVQAIAVAVESHLLDEGDSQQLINAITTAIGNSNVDETILVAAIRADLERTGGKIDAIGTPLQASNYVAPDNTKITAIKTQVDTLQNYNDAALTAKVEAIPTNPVLTTDTRLDAIGEPLQAVDYVAPVNSEIADIKQAVNNLPTLTQIEQSEILAKETSLEVIAETIEESATNTAKNVWEYNNRTLNGDVVE